MQQFPALSRRPLASLLLAPLLLSLGGGCASVSPTAPANPLVAGNWKMHKTIAESTDFVREFLALDPDFEMVDAVIFPPFTALFAEKKLAQGSSYAEANDYTWDEISGRSLLAQLLQRRGEHRAVLDVDQQPMPFG